MVGEAARPAGLADGARTASYHVAALERGLGVLRALAHVGTPLGLGPLQQWTGLPKSTLTRLINVLVDHGYVIRVNESPNFWLGPAILPLADAYTRALDVSSCVRGVLEALAASTGQTSNLAILDEGEVLHLSVVEPDRPIRFRSSTGSRDSAYCTGLGKLLLAFVDEQALERHLPAEPYPARTARTITSRAALETELRRIRRLGYAFDNEEGDVGVCCLAVPMRQDGDVVAAISVTGPAGELGLASHDVLLGRLNEAGAALAADAAAQRALLVARRALPAPSPAFLNQALN
ncbi:MAG TPA: IclR family transcriptional regulator [Acidimicrobiales bacterium]|nr:IclR family transcriptional regulator [Acidimicrobiales bacterium]